jgi:hypothetical protein
MNGSLLTFMALAWFIGFLHGWFGRGYSLKHRMYYDRVDDSLDRAKREPPEEERGPGP